MRFLLNNQEEYMEMVKLTIDGKPVEVEKDTTILKAAKTIGRYTYPLLLSTQGHEH
jgi:predicted molibdopterin-dependent oxidoreductase YjgC